MKTTFILASIAFYIATGFVSVSAQADLSQYKKTSKQAIQTLAKSLKLEMKQAMKSGGPEKAINVCNLKALPITAQVNQSIDGEISRTSLKVRNSANLPDEWELAGLHKLENLRQSGQPAKKLAIAEVVEVNGKKHFRMLKAIPTGKGCLACHGENISPQVKSQLETLYPTDKATGFKVGDIRGAFSVIKEL